MAVLDVFAIVTQKVGSVVAPGLILVAQCALLTLAPLHECCRVLLLAFQSTLGVDLHGDEVLDDGYRDDEDVLWRADDTGTMTVMNGEQDAADTITMTVMNGVQDATRSSSENRMILSGVIDREESFKKHYEPPTH